MPSLTSLPVGVCLTSAQLGELGFSHTTVARLVAAGSLDRVTRGVYTRVRVAEESDRFADERRRHLTLAQAMLHLYEGSYLVGPSACVALGLPLLNAPTHVHLSRAVPIHARRRGLVSRRPWPHTMVRSQGDLLVQETTAAVIEIAALDGVLPGLVTADSAVRSGRLTNRDANLDAWGQRRGVAAARTVLERADGRHESPLETQIAFEARLNGLELIPQVQITDERGQFVARVDFIVARHRVVVEVDGMTKYTAGGLREEKLRQGDIERMGWVVVRVGHRELRAGRVVPLLQDAIAHADALFGTSLSA